MDGTVTRLRAMLDNMNEVFHAGNAHPVVKEEHATGLYGLGGRRMVAPLGLEDRVLARLHTFGKTLVAPGGACLSTCQSELPVDGYPQPCYGEYVDSGLLLNYPRPTNVYDISQQYYCQHCLVLLQPPR
jgi:hypothetical protein